MKWYIEYPLVYGIVAAILWIFSYRYQPLTDETILTWLIATLMISGFGYLGYKGIRDKSKEKNN